MADIQNLNEAWNGHTGLEVQAFIRSRLRALEEVVSAKVGYMEWNGQSLLLYEDGSKENLIDSVALSGDIYRVTVGYEGSRTFSVLTGDGTHVIHIDPSTTHQNGIGGTEEDYSEGYDYVVAFNTGSGYINMLSGEIPIGGSADIDIFPPLQVGTNQVRITVTGKDSHAVSSVTLTATLTNLTFACSHNWRTPWYEGKGYVISGITFNGALTKTLHVAIDGTEVTDLQQTYSSGENAWPTARSLSIPYQYFPLVSAGQHAIELWMTTGSGVSTPHVTFNILFVTEGYTAPLVCINNAVETAVNYSQNDLFEYTTLNADEVEFTITILSGGRTSIESISASNLTDGERNTFSAHIEMPTEAESGSVNVSVTPMKGGEGNTDGIISKNFTLDNHLAFIPASGALFYFTAGSRSNSEASRGSIVNTAISPNTEYEGTWTGMTWASDGWTADKDGNKSLALPAGCSVIFPTLKPFTFKDGDSQADGLTVEMMLRASTVADLDTPILKFTKQVTSGGTTFDVGVFIYPTKILVRGSAEHSDDLVQEVGLYEDKITHLTVTFTPAYRTIEGKNLCSVYVDGVPNVNFAYDINSDYGDGALMMGQDSTDVYLYMMRIYGRALGGTEVLQNFKNAVIDGVEFSRLTLDSANNIVDNGIAYSLAKKQYNCLVFEPDDVTADIPSFFNQTTVQCTVYMEYAGHPERDTKIAHVPIDGQGTTSMRYFRWNLRGKFTDRKEKDGKVTPACEWFYKDSNGQWETTPRFSGKEGFLDGYSDTATNAAGHTKSQRATWKKNVASAPQGHKMGATALYDDLFTALGLKTDLPDENFRVAVWQEPFLGFVKRDGEYTFIGLYTGGPDKGCKTTFGYDKKSYPKAMCIEGPNHNPRGTRFLHPWVNVTYDTSDETLKFGGQEAWDDDFSGPYDSDTKSEEERLAILQMYVDEWKPAYDLVFHCSPYICKLTEAEMNGTAMGSTDAEALEAINANVSSFIGTYQEAGETKPYRSCGEKNSLLSFYDSNYDIYYLQNVNGSPSRFVKLVRQDGDTQDGKWNILTYLGSYLSDAVDPTHPTTAEIVAARAAKFKAEVGHYFYLRHKLLHKCFLMLTGGKDNDAKNSYPFKHRPLDYEDPYGATTHLGNRWSDKQDDLDSLFDGDNNGMATVTYSVEHGDLNNGIEIFQGSDSALWTLIWRNFQYGEGQTIQTMMGEIMDALASMSDRLGLTQTGDQYHNRVQRTMEHYFFSKSSKYFPAIAYQEDREFTYIEPWWLAGTPNPYTGENYPAKYNEVFPLTQALGDRYQSEKLWIERRIAYLMSKYSLGGLTGQEDDWGSFTFGLLSPFTFQITPAIDFYPAGSVGGAPIHGVRTYAGNSSGLSLPSSGEGTTLYIKAMDWVRSLGDLSQAKFVNRTTGSTENVTISITGKRLETLKVGDATGNVAFNCSGMSVSSPAIKEINALNTTSFSSDIDLRSCPRLRRALFGGSHATGLLLPEGARVTEVSFPNYLQTLFLHLLNQLTEENMALGSVADVSTYYFYKCTNLNPLTILETLMSGGSLTNVYMAWDGTLVATGAQTSALAKLADGYKNVTYENGQIAKDNNNPATVSGTIHVEVIDKEMYDAITEAFANLTITYDTMVDYIHFEDSRVAEICAYNWGDTTLWPNGASLYKGEIDCKANTEAMSDYHFACVTAYSAHKSSSVAGIEGSSNDIPAVSAHTEQFTVEVEGTHITAIKVIQAASNTSTLVTLADSTAETNPFSQSGNKYTALVTTTNACQYLRVAVTTDADETVSYNIITASDVHRHPAGMSKAQAECVTSLQSKMRGNTLITKFNELKFFISVVNIALTFAGCANLEEIDLRNITVFGGDANTGPLSGTKISIVKIPKCTAVQHYIFRIPNTLVSVICGDDVTKVRRYIANMTNNTPKRLVIQSLTPPTYEAVGAGGDRITNWSSTCKLYVPDSVVDDYKAATAFANITQHILPLSEYPYPDELIWDD